MFIWFLILGDTIELQCTVLHWGNGDPDLKFHLFHADGSILRDEVTLDKRDKSLYLTTKLDRYHHGKRFGEDIRVRERELYEQFKHFVWTILTFYMDILYGHFIHIL